MMVSSSLRRLWLSWWASVFVAIVVVVVTRVLPEIDLVTAFNGHHVLPVVVRRPPLPQPSSPSSLLATVDDNNNNNNNNDKILQHSSTTSSSWSKRYAASVEEGIRRERSSSSSPGNKKQKKRSDTLAQLFLETTTRSPDRHKIASRTISGLVAALAEEARDLEVDVENPNRKTPWSRKQVDTIRIKFSRLGFKPIRMGALDSSTTTTTTTPLLSHGTTPLPHHHHHPHNTHNDTTNTTLTTRPPPVTSDEAFSRIDADNSGALDVQELASALRAMTRDAAKSSSLAARLVSLYDTDGDRELDRQEYQTMAEDMAALRECDNDERVEEVVNDSKHKTHFCSRWFPTIANDNDTAANTTNNTWQPASRRCPICPK